jgi:hypothetical protein
LVLGFSFLVLTLQCFQDRRIHKEFATCYAARALQALNAVVSAMQSTNNAVTTEGAYMFWAGAYGQNALSAISICLVVVVEV